MVEGSTEDGEQQIIGQSGHNYKLEGMAIVRVVGIPGLEQHICVGLLNNEQD